MSALGIKVEELHQLPLCQVKKLLAGRGNSEKEQLDKDKKELEEEEFSLKFFGDASETAVMRNFKKRTLKECAQLERQYQEQALTEKIQ